MSLKESDKTSLHSNAGIRLVYFLNMFNCLKMILYRKTNVEQFNIEHLAAE